MSRSEDCGRSFSLLATAHDCETDLRKYVSAQQLYANHRQSSGPVRNRSFLVFVTWTGRPLWVVSVSQGRNLIITIAFAHIALDWRCLIVTRHSYWERRSSGSKQDNRICFAREKKNYMRCESSCHDCCFNFVRKRPAPEARRRNLWCLSGPAESLSHWYRPSARGSIAGAHAIFERKSTTFNLAMKVHNRPPIWNPHNLPKQEEALIVKLCMSRAPRNDHLNRNSCALVLKFIPSSSHCWKDG